MRINDAWRTDPATQAVCRMLCDAGHQALFVGGCVRNAMLGLPVSDIDLATDARPDRVLSLASAAGLKTVPTGIDHGTVTVIASGHPYEVTTFREDVQTLGRHAVVAFCDDITADARRRDFTMNALYAKPDGTILDPLGGLNDLLARRVRFIEGAHRRIREDYLRILRFFRFHALYGDPAAGLDPVGLSACAAHLDGLVGLSRERIGTEMRKLLAAADPAPAVTAMQDTGVLERILPGADAAPLARLITLEPESPAAPDAVLRLAALGADAPDHRLRLSKSETRRLEQLNSAAISDMTALELGYRFGTKDGRAILLLRAARRARTPDHTLFADLAKGAAAVFPVSAHDLMPDYTGAQLGARLNALERRWIASGCTLTREDLL